MEKLITVEWFNSNGDNVQGDAIVEFIRYDEDGNVVNEVINVFLPEHTFEYDRPRLTQSAIESFHNGEGFEL